MNLNNLDLNLFLVFQAVYATRSATLAGDRLGVTQSAVSAALKRMRERFNDPLFVRTADGMVPTALADRLIAPIQDGLARLQQAVEQGSSFDAQTSDRTFRIAINEIGQMVVLPRLLAEARRLAPTVRFETIDARVPDARLRMQEGEIDLAMGSWEPIGPTFYQQRLFDETFAIVMRRANPAAERKKLDLETYLAADHIAYRPNGTTDLVLQQTLEAAGILSRRRVVFCAAHSTGLGQASATSDLLLTLPSRLAEQLVSLQPLLVMRPAPFAVTTFEIRQQWHARLHLDGGNRWLRQLIFQLFHEPSRHGRNRHAGMPIGVPIIEAGLGVTRH
ncbi:LysR-family transcriptional regulator [plant metagenome]|uniref:LysR-family transcriptional regulator n=1 Tax=plant metagenome TaxID=1297885 RepID=A0A484Q4J2_9ZZZZ